MSAVIKSIHVETQADLVVHMLVTVDEAWILDGEKAVMLLT